MIQKVRGKIMQQTPRLLFSCDANLNRQTELSLFFVTPSDLLIVLIQIKIIAFRIQRLTPQQQVISSHVTMIMSHVYFGEWDVFLIYSQKTELKLMTVMKRDEDVIIWSSCHHLPSAIYDPTKKSTKSISPSSFWSLSSSTTWRVISDNYSFSCHEMWYSCHWVLEWW